MIAYLIAGTEDTAFTNLQAQLATNLEIVPEFANRAHKNVKPSTYFESSSSPSSHDDDL
jgi:hypothetical protein